ncbi:ABC transporter permease subunit [Bradyrhizobium sp. Arg237L]|uniref:ABC transporter permease subunit n=1 Tax=Bradyrhizobium sp. Arg237L TaxID=3003352 RepID=UPI00249ED1F4|nr:ABC transporter permease subunit [Bradyrhizobium sp. Arg237L]MDI4232861.1 ABC transporter permease subunit [Bradyrhizobium sp. Arg237L]
MLRSIRLRSAMPGVLAGLRVAASLSVLGAILGEFGSGERWGLGTFLLGSLGQSDADRLWGISMAAAALALTGYGLFSLGSSMVGATIPVTVAAGRMPDELHGQDGEADFKRYLMVIASVALPFVLWWAVLKWADVSPIVAPRPWDVVSYLTFADGSDEARSALLHAVGQTIPMALLGLFVGLGIAFLLAALSVVMPGLLKVILPAAMVLQSTPLVALTPIVLLLLGRTISACIFMAVVVVVFFPAFVLLVQGFAVVPRAALETVEVYGGGPIQKLRFISIPYSFRYIAAAAKLVAPRALLGVMIAEWLLTGTGLGNLMDVSRGSLDYGMVWSGAVLSIMISVLAYRGADLLERSIHVGRAA